jgi:5'-nucleotidase
LLATATYTITTNTFLAEGGDEFHAFRRGKNLRIGPPQRETVQKYLTDLSAAGPIPARLVDRIQSD